MSVFHLGLAALLFLAAPAMAQVNEGQNPASAQDVAAESADIAALVQALKLDELLGVLRDEGIAYGSRLEAEMFPSGGGPGWPRAVDLIYDLPALKADFIAALEAELGDEPEVLAEILAFYATDTGARVVTLEIEARRAFLDQAAEDAARVSADKRRAGRDPRVEQIERFITAGDLLEMNVAGALSGNLAFLMGMNESGAYGAGLPRDQLMENIWGQEDEIRDDLRTWLHAYLGLAYEPLSAAELDIYVDFMASPAGKRLNAALFLAFDRAFRRISYDLGRAAGVAIVGRDI